MGAFADGFKLGGSFYDQAEESKRQKVLDERATEEYGQRQTAYQRGLKIQGETDDALARVKGLDGGVFEGSKANFNINDGMAGAGPMPAEAMKLPSEGLQSRKATDLEYNRAFQGVALAKQDIAGLQALRVTGKGFEYDDAYKNSSDKWDAMKDEERAALISKVSYDQSIPGFGNWVPGTGKTAGYMNYMPPGGDPVKLSAKDAKQFYAITNAMENDPARARKEMESASASVRAIAKEVFSAQTLGVKENNDMARDAAKTAIEQQKADQIGAYYRSMAGGGGGGGGGSKSLDSRYVSQLNDLAQRASEEVDPAKRALIERDYQRMYSVAMTTIGKVSPLRDQRAARPEISNKDLMDFSEKFGAAPTRVPDPRNPGSFLTVGQLSPQQQVAEATAYFGRSREADVGGYPEIAPPPRRGSPDDGVKAPTKPARGITTIIPPRSAADMRPQVQLTDGELAAMAMGIRR